MAKRIQTEERRIRVRIIREFLHACVLLLLAAGLFVKIGVAAQFIHHVH